MKDRELIDQLKGRVDQEFGFKCRTFTYHCATCAAHMAVDILEDLFINFQDVEDDG